MPLFDIIIALSVLAASVSTWTKIKNKTFFLFSILSVIILVGDIFVYFTEKFFVVANISSSLLIIGASWLHWKQYRNRLFFYFIIAAIILLLSKLYRFYI